ncbi:hypothetical protein EDB84DRAFT_1557694 [Lactarius hengduanensis]|nr:hypothetical protein EDB84DRAFT_1557694 [Lactarius hengduanensis]
MQLLFGEEGVWEAYTPLLSPLGVLKSLPSPFGVLGYPHACRTPTSPFGSDHDSDSDSDDGTASSATLLEPHLREDVAPVDWGATGTFAGSTLALETHALEARAIATSTPQAKSLRAPCNHQDVPSRERPNQNCHAPRRHATPRSYVPVNGTLVVGGLQDICLRGGVCNASGPKKSQKKCASPRQKVFPYRRTVKRRNYGPEDWLSSGDPKKRAEDDDALSTCAVYAEREDNRLSRAPLLRTVALPDEEESSSAASEEFLYGGPDLGGWLTGTFDGVPKMVTLEHLNLPVPVAFPAEEPLLAFPGVELGKQEYGIACE